MTIWAGEATSFLSRSRGGRTACTRGCCRLCSSWTRSRRDMLSRHGGDWVERLWFKSKLSEFCQICTDLEKINFHPIFNFYSILSNIFSVIMITLPILVSIVQYTTPLPPKPDWEIAVLCLSPLSRQPISAETNLCVAVARFVWKLKSRWNPVLFESWNNRNLEAFHLPTAGWRVSNSEKFQLLVAEN